MKIDELLIRGQAHPRQCEDALFHGELGQKQYLAAVMDGCSNGIDSYFASALIQKILKQLTRELFYKSLHLSHPPPKQHIGFILKRVFDQLRIIQQQLMLDRYELLTTLVMGIIHTGQRSGTFIAIGDGVIHCNGEWYEFEQNNQPDYLAYHLNEDFDIWLARQEQWLICQNMQQLTLATDGLFSFEATHPDTNPTFREQIPNVLVQARDRNLLQDFRRIESTWKYLPMDDLALIRIQFPIE